MSDTPYAARGEFGIAGRRFFTRRHAGTPCHLHAFARGDAHLARHLALRDYLRRHPEARDAYAALKRALACAHRDDAARYAPGKDDFVRRTEAAALGWRAGHVDAPLTP